MQVKIKSRYSLLTLTCNQFFFTNIDLWFVSSIDLDDYSSLTLLDLVLKRSLLNLNQ